MISLSLKFLLIVLFQRFSATISLSRCYQTSDCPDPGTVCKIAKLPADSMSENPAIFTELVTGTTRLGAYDPNANVLNDDSDSSVSLSADSSDLSQAKIAKLITPPKTFELKKGANVKVDPKWDSGKTTILVDSSNTVSGGVGVTDKPGVIHIGSRLIINGWGCMVNDIKSPGGKIDKSALNDYDGSFKAESNDAIGNPSNGLSPLIVGAIVKMGKITCKIVSSPSKNEVKSTSTKSRFTETIPGTTAAITTQSPATSLSKLITKPTISPVQSPQSGQILGRCVCDSTKRFACTSDTDCSLRFKNSTISCFDTVLCPTQLGTGYCRFRSTEVVLSDAVSSKDSTKN